MSSASSCSRTIESALRRNGCSYLRTRSAKRLGCATETASNSSSECCCSACSKERYDVMFLLYHRLTPINNKSATKVTGWRYTIWCEFCSQTDIPRSSGLLFYYCGHHRTRHCKPHTRVRCYTVALYRVRQPQRHARNRVLHEI